MFGSVTPGGGVPRGGYGLDEEELRGVKGLETKLQRFFQLQNHGAQNFQSFSNPEFEMSARNFDGKLANSGKCTFAPLLATRLPSVEGAAARKRHWFSVEVYPEG